MILNNNTNQDTKLSRIGAGFCGTVWGSSQTSSAFKREDGGPDRSLRNDFEKHRKVLDSLRQIPHVDTSISIPSCYRFIQPTDISWWAENLARFPEGYSPCNVIESQRIPPLSHPVREALVRKYCPEDLAAEIMASEANRDCLVRPYLGRRRTQQNQVTRRSRFKAFSLRNYPLHIDQMEEIGIPLEHRIGYAHAMAETLAIMHWKAKIDANDVEFVLAPPPAGQTARWTNFLGEHVIWVLDFDLCRDMSMDEQGVQQAVVAFWRNDPFYPRPAQNCSLWQAFRHRYLQLSRQVAGSEVQVSLSKLFVGMCEDDGLRSK